MTSIMARIIISVPVMVFVTSRPVTMDIANIHSSYATNTNPTVIPPRHRAILLVINLEGKTQIPSNNIPQHIPMIRFTLQTASSVNPKYPNKFEIARNTPSNLAIIRLSQHQRFFLPQSASAQAFFCAFLYAVPEGPIVNMATVGP